MVRGQFDRDVGPMTWMRIDANGTAADTLDRARTILGIKDRSQL